jgi:hypothetical protein
MKVKIPNGNFIPVNLLRELETSRSSLATKNIKKKTPASTLFIENSDGNAIPLSLNWVSSSSNDDNSFIVVENR